MEGCATWFVKRVTRGRSLRHHLLIGSSAAWARVPPTPRRFPGVRSSGSTRRILLYAGDGGSHIATKRPRHPGGVPFDLGPRGWPRTVGASSPRAARPTSRPFDATGLIGGHYLAALVLSSNDPDEAEVTVPAHLQVTGVPDVAASPAFLSFGSVLLGATSTREVTVSNVGTDVLTVSAVTFDHPDFGANASSFSLAAGETPPTVTSRPPRPATAALHDWPATTS